MGSIVLPKGEYTLEHEHNERIGMYIRLLNPDSAEIPTVLVILAFTFTEWLPLALGHIVLEVTHHWDFSHWAVTKEGFTYWHPLCQRKTHLGTTARLEVYGCVPPLETVED
ncbi:MAG: hypothetical protein KOO60_10905 [Gemmatimonadales bacterium]|nr:hypothetical protein [Gemmatimonadales bacterium]